LAIGVPKDLLNATVKMCHCNLLKFSTILFYWQTLSLVYTESDSTNSKYGDSC